MTYGCQQYTITRLCRYDRRAIDRRCDGCPRTTDSEYLKSMGLWVEGISHAEYEVEEVETITIRGAHADTRFRIHRHDQHAL